MNHGAGSSTAGYLKARGLYLLCTCIILAIFFAHAFHYTTEIVDDAWISFRYALNLANGHGFTFNAGEAVEGSSAPLFVFLLASILALTQAEPANLLEISRFIGISSSLLTMLLVFWMAVHRYKQPVPVGLLICLGLALNPYTAFWTVNGMETTFHGFVMLAVFCGLECVRTRQGNLGIGSGAENRLAAGTLALITCGVAIICASRPEAPAFAGAYIAYRMADHAVARQALPVMQWAAAGIAGLGLVLGARYAYFSDILPNTYYAKILSMDIWRVGGWLYLKSFFAPNLPVAGLHSIAALGIILGFRKEYVAHLILLIGCFAFAYYSAGDWMFNFRFAIAAIPSYLLLLVCGLLTWPKIVAQHNPTLRYAVTLALIAGLMLHWAQLYMIYKERPYYVWDTTVTHKDSVLPSHLPGDPVKPLIIYPTGVVLDYCPNNQRVMMPDIGLPAFLIDNKVLDSRGLTDQAAAKALYYGSRNLESADTRFWMAQMNNALLANPPCAVTLLRQLQYPIEVSFQEHAIDRYERVDDRTYILKPATRLPLDQRLQRWHTAWSRIPRSREITYRFVNLLTAANDRDGLCKVYNYYEKRPRLYRQFQTKLESALVKLSIPKSKCAATQRSRKS